MANAPHDDEFVQLHVRHVPGGRVHRHVFQTMKERDTCAWKDRSAPSSCATNPRSPSCSSLGHRICADQGADRGRRSKKGVKRPMRLYWGARRPKDLYLNGLAERWARDIRGLSTCR